MERLREYKRHIAEHNRRVTPKEPNEPIKTYDETTYSDMFSKCYQACYEHLNPITKTDRTSTTFIYPVDAWYYDDDMKGVFMNAFTNMLKAFGITVKNYYIDNFYDTIRVCSDLEWVRISSPSYTL
jgi:hypothetical protein